MKPKFLFIVSLSCLLLVGPCYGKQRRTATKQPVKQEQPEAQAVPASPPPTLAQMPASPPQVSFQGGQLTISAQNSTLGDILKAVRTQTGATIDLPGTAPERVVGQFGPAPARDVLTSLLNGSHFNYLLLGSPTDPGALDRVILMAKSGGPAENPQPPSEQASANQPVYNRPIMPMAAPGGNTVTVEGQDADDSTDDSADSTDDTQADDQTDQTDQPDDQQATDDQQQQQQQQQDGQQPVKTPEQLLQQLQQRQQQMQQQGIQPGMAPGFPNPGMVPVQPGAINPPHN